MAWTTRGILSSKLGIRGQKSGFPYFETIPKLGNEHPTASGGFSSRQSFVVVAYHYDLGSRRKPSLHIELVVSTDRAPHNNPKYVPKLPFFSHVPATMIFPGRDVESWPVGCNVGDLKNYP